MKKLLSLALLLSVSMAFGQSLIVYSADTVAIGNASSSTDIESHIRIKNTSKTDIDVRVKRLDRNYNNLTDSNAICWNLCYQTSVSVSPNTITIPADGISGVSEFVGHVYPDRDGVPMSGVITYVFFNQEDPNDSVAHTVNYKVTQDFSVSEGNISKGVSVYPNPVVGEATVKYFFDSNKTSFFELYNLLGTKVYEKAFAGREGSFRLNASGFSKGVYYYVLKQDGEIVETKKIIIK